MKHNRTLRLVEGLLSVPVDHVGDEFIHSWLVHGKKATQPHTEWRKYNRGIVHEINMQTCKGSQSV